MALISRTRTIERPQPIDEGRHRVNSKGEALENVVKTSKIQPSETWVLIMRLFYLNMGVAGYIWCNDLQELTNNGWEYLCSTWVFNSVYFETWWATVSYILIIAFPYVMIKSGLFSHYKIDPNLRWQPSGIKGFVLETVVYCGPLMILDTFIVKRYEGVDPEEWRYRAHSFIQKTRALPQDPPTVFKVIYQLLLSFLIYDFLFFIVHLSLHKNLWLYKTVHATHHEHSAVHTRVTNQLSVTERIILILSANQSLKLCKAHPLTRTIFVPLFIAMLVENHCGYDLPFTLDKVVPFGIFGGSAQHYKHHIHGSRNYQPFFTHLDKVLQLYYDWRKVRSKVIN